VDSEGGVVTEFGSSRRFATTSTAQLDEFALALHRAAVTQFRDHRFSGKSCVGELAHISG
jgi:hypothetical protein